MWCIQDLTPEYRKRMYRLADLYQADADPQYPVVCLDEKSKQLLQDTRAPLSGGPGKPQKYDYEYERKGTCNVFVAVAPKEGRRVVKVTDRRAKADFAHFVEELVDNHFAEATQIQLVLDNLNTHFAGSLVETFGALKAERLLKKVCFIHTPVHASWLNMAEIEIGVMDRQCTGGRIASKEALVAEVESWSRARNEKQLGIKWTFTKQQAYMKLAKHYVQN